MKLNKVYWISLVVVMALALTGCLGSSVEDKKEEVNVKAQLEELTDKFVKGFTSESPDSEEFYALFANEMKFTVIFEGAVDLPDMGDFATLIESALVDEEFRLDFLAGAPEFFLEKFDELIPLYDEHGIDSEKVQDAIKETIDAFLKVSLLAGLILSDPENPMPDIIEWAEQSDLLTDRIEMPRDVFEVFTSFRPWLFADSMVVNKTQPTQDNKGKWHVVLDVVMGELNDDPGFDDTLEPTTITLGFTKSGSKWVIDRFQLNSDILK